MAFSLLIDFRAHEDIDNATEYYMSKNSVVANKLYNNIQDAYFILYNNPFFEIRYLKYRCLPIKDFPYMFHFSVNEKENLVQIHAPINTSKSTEDNWLKD